MRCRIVTILATLSVAANPTVAEPLALASPQATTENSVQHLRVAVPVANIRLEPSTASPVVAKVERGTVLRVQSVENGWARVALVANGLDKQGYILASLGRLEMLPTERRTTLSTPTNEPPVEPRESPRPVAQSSGSNPPVGLAPVVPDPKASGIAGEQRSTPISQGSRPPGQLGLGAQLGVNPGGLVPSVLYDLNRTATIRGMFTFGSGYSSYAGQLLYRFHRPPNPNSKILLVPYVGGGLFIINVDYGFGSESFTGGIASGGVSFTFKSYPRIRYSVDLNMPLYSHGTFAQPAVYGVYLGLGGHYFF